LKAANVTIFSPQMEKARINLLTNTVQGIKDMAGLAKTNAYNAARGKPMQKIDAATLVKARVGIKLMTGLGLTYALANAAGGKSDLNPFSSGFGNIDAGSPSPMNSAASVAAAELGVGTANYAGKNVQFNPTASIA